MENQHVCLLGRLSLLYVVLGRSCGVLGVSCGGPWAVSGDTTWLLFRLWLRNKNSSIRPTFDWPRLDHIDKFIKVSDFQLFGLLDWFLTPRLAMYFVWQNYQFKPFLTSWITVSRCYPSASCRILLFSLLLYHMCGNSKTSLRLARVWRNPLLQMWAIHRMYWSLQ